MNTFKEAIAALINSVNTPDKWTGVDKNLHLTFGAATAFIVAYITDSVPLGISAGVVVGFGKEVYDAFNLDKHTPSFKDFVVTSLGAGIGGFVYHLHVYVN